MIKFFDKNDNNYFTVSDDNIVNTETENTFLFITLKDTLDKNILNLIQSNNKCYIDDILYKYKYHIYAREISSVHNSLLYTLGIQLLKEEL